jgi:hypothetical protein
MERNKGPKQADFFAELEKRPAEISVRSDLMPILARDMAKAIELPPVYTHVPDPVRSKRARLAAANRRRFGPAFPSR